MLQDRLIALINQEKSSLAVDGRGITVVDLWPNIRPSARSLPLIVVPSPLRGPDENWGGDKIRREYTVAIGVIDGTGTAPRRRRSGEDCVDLIAEKLKLFLSDTARAGQSWGLPHLGVFVSLCRFELGEQVPGNGNNAVMSPLTITVPMILGRMIPIV
jgi:hypothetical protein